MRSEGGGANEGGGEGGGRGRGGEGGGMRGKRLVMRSEV